MPPSLPIKVVFLSLRLHCPRRAPGALPLPPPAQWGPGYRRPAPGTEPLWVPPPRPRSGSRHRHFSRSSGQPGGGRAARGPGSITGTGEGRGEPPAGPRTGSGGAEAGAGPDGCRRGAAGTGIPGRGTGRRPRRATTAVRGTGTGETGPGGDARGAAAVPGGAGGGAPGRVSPVPPHPGPGAVRGSICTRRCPVRRSCPEPSGAPWGAAGAAGGSGLAPSPLGRRGWRSSSLPARSALRTPFGRRGSSDRSRAKLLTPERACVRHQRQGGRK